MSVLRRGIELGMALAALGSAGSTQALGVGGSGGVPQSRERARTQMTVELEIPPKVRAGEPVPITLRVRNTGTQQGELTLTGRPAAFNIVGTSEDGRVVWSRLDGEVVSTVLQMKILWPGEALELTPRWDQGANNQSPFPPGTYNVRAFLPTEERHLTPKPRPFVAWR